MNQPTTGENAFLAATLVVMLAAAVTPLAILLHYWTPPPGQLSTFVTGLSCMVPGVPIMVLTNILMLKLGERIGVLK